MLTLVGIVIVVAGFLARLNPLLVVAVAAIATGLAGGMSPVHVVSAFGKAFNDNRYVSVIWLVLPVIGLLERAGLQARARQLIAKLRGATSGRILLVYLVVRQITSALGLVSLGGHAQMVRPLIAPMAEAAAETRFGPLSDSNRDRIRAYAASADNVGVFFGEDIFIAIGSIAVITAFMRESGIMVQPIQLSVWAIPTAILAFLIHGARLLLLDRRLRREAASAKAPQEPAA